MSYETHENPDVLQREWVEAVAAQTIAEADFRRRKTEAENAESNYQAAKAKADDYEGRYLAARDAARADRGLEAPAAPATTKRAPLATAKADEGPAL